MAFSTLEFASYPRAEIRQHVDKIRVSSNSPMPATAVDEIADLACHAAATGRSALMRVLDGASHAGVSGTALGIAASLLKSDMERIQSALQQYSQDSGTPFFNETITIGGQSNG